MDEKLITNALAGSFGLHGISAAKCSSDELLKKISDLEMKLKKDDTSGENTCVDKNLIAVYKQVLNSLLNVTNK